MAAILDNNAIYAAFAHPLPDGAFEPPVREYLRAVGTRRPILLLAFAPKSAGTYFRQAAIYAVNGQLVRLCHAQGGRDGTPYLPNILANCLDDTAPAPVTHLHMQALMSNRHLVEAVGLKPVIMIRNIADMLASFLDMLEADPLARAEGLNCHIPENFGDMTRAEKLDFIIDVIAPWYASYFATWKRFSDDAPRTVCVLHYRDLCRDQAETLNKALSHAGFSVTRQTCSRSVTRAWEERQSHRYNKGVAGRGQSYFTPAHLERLQRLVSYYPELRPWRADLLGQITAPVPAFQI
jgi:hypothetical protein